MRGGCGLEWGTPRADYDRREFLVFNTTPAMRSAVDIAADDEATKEQRGQWI